MLSSFFTRDGIICGVGAAKQSLPIFFYVIFIFNVLPPAAKGASKTMNRKLKEIGLTISIATLSQAENLTSLSLQDGPRSVTIF